MPKGLDGASSLVEPMGLDEENNRLVEPMGVDEEINRLVEPMGLYEEFNWLVEHMGLDEEFNRMARIDENRVFISYSPAQKHFGEQLCEDIKSRGRGPVGDVVEECGIIVVILHEEYLLSKPSMLDLAAIAKFRKGNNYVRVVPAFLGVSPAECRAPRSQWLEVWQNWANSDSQIDVGEWLRALQALSSINGVILNENSEHVSRQIIVDDVCYMQHSELEFKIEASRTHWSELSTSDGETYESLQEDALLNGPGLVADWCWISRKPDFTDEEFLGRGSSKSVMKCQWEGMFVAVAQFTGEKTELEAEAGLLARVQHPNVVKMIGCYYDDSRGMGYLVTELMEQDLSKLIKEAARRDIPGASTRNAQNQELPLQGDGVMPFTVSVARDIILQIVEAMIHIHKRGVVHRDLKPANCVVSEMRRIEGNDGVETYYVVKVIDFGSAKVLHPGASTCHTRKRGTTPFMAPELHAEEEKCAYKGPADVYSFGMTMYVIFTGKSPFEGECFGGELVRRVCDGKRPSFPDCIPDFWKQLIENCWHPDPGQRPSFKSIRNYIHTGTWGFEN